MAIGGLQLYCVRSWERRSQSGRAALPLPPVMDAPAARHEGKFPKHRFVIKTCQAQQDHRSNRWSCLLLCSYLSLSGPVKSINSRHIRLPRRSSLPLAGRSIQLCAGGDMGGHLNVFLHIHLYSFCRVEVFFFNKSTYRRLCKPRIILSLIFFPFHI